MQKRSRCITNNGDNVKNDLYSKTVKTRSSIKGMIKRKVVSMMFHLTISFLSILQKETSNFDVSRKIWNKHFPGHWIFQSLSSYQNFCWKRVSIKVKTVQLWKTSLFPINDDMKEVNQYIMLIFYGICYFEYDKCCSRTP